MLTPHQAAVQLASNDFAGETYTLFGHLGNKEAIAVQDNTGLNYIQTATWLFRYEDGGKIGVGDRITVNGGVWAVISPIVMVNEIFALRHSKCQVEKIVDLDYGNNS